MVPLRSNIAAKGRLGRVLSSLSTDLRAFAAGSAAISALIFVVLELFFHPTPSLTSFVSLLVSILMAWIIHASTKRTHLDLMRTSGGNRMTGDGLSGNAVSRWQSKLKLSTLIHAVPPLIIGGALVMSVMARFDVDRIFNARTSMFMHVAPILMLAFVAVVLVDVLRWCRMLKNPNVAIATGALLASVLVNAVVVLVAPAADVWYYVGDIVCVVGLLVSSTAFFRLCNVFLARQLTESSDRKEV